ncbi:MAG: rhomboid family intramembrane serine protease [Verrucomicrobiales bacterium]|nr:rhomboid family intramembrane serine protease [Verrucomicrobiales bacterium]
MLFPLSDDDRHLVRPAWVTQALLAANVALFLVQLASPDFTLGYSVIPAEIVRGIDLAEPVVVPDPDAGGMPVEVPQAPGPWPIHLTLITAMFLHGGWAHLGGNMLYLWIFGDNVEHRFGSLRFLLFYLVSGLAATAAQIATDPNSIIPNLGASGAISGVLGAYLVLFPHNRVMALFFFRVVSIPAVLVLGLWAAMQVISGWGSLSGGGAGGLSGGVAYAAHLGGLVAGIVFGLLARLTLKEEPDTPFRRIYEGLPHRAGLPRRGRRQSWD